MVHFFERRDPWGFGPAVWVLTAMAFLAPIAWWSIRQIDLENDVENWLPADDPQAAILAWSKDHFPERDSVLISWRGGSLDDPRARIFARKLEGTPDNQGVRRGGSPYVTNVITPFDLIERMESHGVDRADALKRVEGVLVGRGMLKVRLTEAGRQRRKQVESALIDRAARDLGIDVQIEPSAMDFADAVEVDDDAIPETLDENGEPVEPPKYLNIPRHDFQVAWKGMHAGVHSPAGDETVGAESTVEPVGKSRALIEMIGGLRGRPAGGDAADADTRDNESGPLLVDESFFAAGGPIAFSAELSEAGDAETEDALADVRRIAAESGIDPEDVHLGGRAVAGSALNEQVKHAGWNRAFPFIALHKRSVVLLSCVVGVVLAFLVLRSVRLAMFVLIAALYTTFITVATVPVTNGSMNMVLVVMPTLLMVLTISAAIHVANYWRHAAAVNPRTAVVEAAKTARIPCALASITTAVGLLSLATSPLKPVSDFGVYSAVGCLVSLAVVLYGLPAMLEFWPGKPLTTAEVDRSFWHGLGRGLGRGRYLVIGACTVGLIAAASGLAWFRTETKVIRYFPDDSLVVQDYEFLEENLSGIVPVETIIRFDEAAQRDMNFIERMEVVREVENGMRGHAEISGALSLADFQPPAEPPPPAAASFFQKAGYNRRMNELERRVKESTGTAAAAFVTTAKRPVDLEVAKGRVMSVGKGDELWRITAQAAIMSDLDYADLTGDWRDPSEKPGALNTVVASVLRGHPGSDHVVTGMVPLFLRTQQAVLDSLVVSFGLAFVVIAGMMMVLLRHPVAGLITMLPNLLPVGVVFGLVSWCGIAVDIGTMITASVALGIAVDGTLHLLTWFRNGLRDGMSRQRAVSKALEHCGPAMIQTSMVVGIGLLMLWPAELLLVSRFGWMMSAMIGAALIADLILLPALLAGPLGALIENTIRRPAPAPVYEPAAHAHADALEAVHAHAPLAHTRIRTRKAGVVHAE